MAKRKAGKKTGGVRKAGARKKRSTRKKALKKRVIKKVTVRDLELPTDEFGGRHKARVARRPLMRDIRLDQKRVTKWQKEDFKTLRARRG